MPRAVYAESTTLGVNVQESYTFGGVRVGRRGSRRSGAMIVPPGMGGDWECNDVH